MPLALVILIDLLVLGLALVVFALFHHVIPRQEEAVGIVSQRVSSAVQASGFSVFAATPDPVAEATAELMATTAPVSTTTAEPTVTAAPASTATAEPTATAAPASTATTEPTATAVPTVTATPAPTLKITAEPTAVPTATPSPTPTAAPTPTPKPTAEPMPVAVDATAEPTPVPTPDPVGWFGTKFADKFTDGEVIQTEDSYRSAYLNVSVKNVRDLGTEIYIADIYVKDIACFKTCLAKDIFGRGYNERLRSMAERMGGVVTINGDYYGSRSSGVVIRNGVLYRDDDSPDADVCVLYWDGTMQTFSPDEFNAMAEIERGAYQAWSFGPELLDADGKAMEDFNSRVKPRNPRTAIGYYEPGHYCFVVVDGRSYESIGMTMKNLSLYMEGLGCKAAYNLDGGESSQMVWGTKRFNKPSDGGRVVSDALLIVDGPTE